MRTLLLIALLASLFMASAFAQSRPVSEASEPVPGIVLVKFAPEVLGEARPAITSQDLHVGAASPLQQQLRFTEGRKIFRGFTAADTLATSRTGRPVRLIDLSRWYTLKVADTTDVAALVERLAKLPGIEAAAPEYPVAPHDVFPNDPEFQLGNQWGLHNTFRPGNDIHAPAAWSYNKGRSDVVVAVVDGGVDYNHADLDPGNRSRVIQGYDTADNDSDPMDDIPAGQGFANHGTQVAGVIGALTNNGTQVAGVLWNTQIMPIKIAYTDGPWWDPFQMFSGPGSAFRTNIGQGIDYARSHGADIINLSLGSPAEDAPGTWELFFLGNPVGEAIWNAYQQGVTVFASSGNDYDAQVGYPASHPGAIAVGASTSSDQRRGSSNYGERLDLVAPSGFLTTSRGGTVGGFGGTSQAAPVAAGVGGLILSESRDLGLGLTNDDIRHLLQQTADDVNASQFPGRDDRIGYGRINAEAALAALQPPNTVTHASVTGGSSSVVWDDHAHTFFNSGYLASGVYYGVETHEVTGHVTFSQPYESTPLVWARERTTQGWSAANPNNELPYVQISNVTRYGFEYKTYVFWIESDAAGEEVEQYYPVSPSQVTVAYTVVGQPGQPEPLSVYISGPTSLDVGEEGTWIANVSGGQTPYSYQWDYKLLCGSLGPQGTPEPMDVTCDQWHSGGSGTSFSRTTNGDATLRLKLTVTDAASTSEIAYKNVTIGSGGGAFAAKQADGQALAGQSLAGVPAAFALQSNYPNPFNPTTEIRFALPEATQVRLVVYDVLGREVATLLDRPMEAGRHRARFDAADLPSGTYLYRLEAGAQVQTRRMTLVK